MNTFNLTAPVYIVNPVANVDSRYGPWTSIAVALTSVSPSVRERGLTVGILESGNVLEYYWKNGTNDNQLVLKNPDLTLFQTVSSNTQSVYALVNSNSSFWSPDVTVNPFVVSDSFNPTLSTKGEISIRANSNQISSNVINLNYFYRLTSQPNRQFVSNASIYLSENNRIPTLNFDLSSTPQNFSGYLNTRGMTVQATSGNSPSEIRHHTDWTYVNLFSARDVIYGRLGSLDTQLNATSTNGVQNSAIAVRIQNIENSLNLVSPPPTYNAPIATLSNFSPSILEVGETINQNLNINWSQNDAGPVVTPFFVLNRSGSLAAQNSVPFNFSVNEVTTLGTVTFRNTVTFSDGPIKNNILGLPDTRGRILSGSVFTERSYSARYKVFFGSVTSVPTNLRTLTGVNWDTVNSFSFFAHNTNNVIVIPFNKQLVSVITSNFETITNNFALSSTTVPNGGGVPVSYNRYVQTTVVPFDLRLDVVLANV